MNAEQLKASILKLAIEGKLVAQSDLEASVEQIGVEPEEKPFDLPSKWKWVKLEDLIELVRGITFPAGAKSQEQTEGTVRCLTTGSVQKVHNVIADVFVSSSYVKKEHQYLRALDIVISSANSRELVGKSILWEDSTEGIAFGGFLTVARVKHEALNARFAFYVFQALFSLRFFENLSTQTTNIANLSNSLLSKVLLPIPPVGEQDRIVSKIEELLPLVESYGKSYDRLQELNGELPNKLKASILQEAIQGKLVPQLLEDGVVEQIGVEPKEPKFDIPSSWKWCVLRELVTPTKQKIPDERFTYIDVASIDGFKITNAKMLEAHDAPSRARKIVKDGMILYSTVRPYLKNISIASGLQGEVIASTAFATFSCSEKICNRYLFYVLVSEYMNAYVKSVQKGVAYPAINDKDFYSVYIPVPPMPEQVRIVARLEELLMHVDALSAR